MPNRVLLGKRGSTDYGLFVSRDSQDVLTSTQPLGFDSRAAESLIVHSVSQGILVPDLVNTSGTQVGFTFNGVFENQHTATITHNLGYVPCFAVRWCTFNQITSGLATETYPPFSYSIDQGERVEEGEEDGDEVTFPGSAGFSGLVISSTTNNTIVLKNNVSQTHDDDFNPDSNGNMTAGSVFTNARYFWSCVIFTAENFLNGESL